MYARYEKGKRDCCVVEGDIITFYLKEETPERIEKAFRKTANDAIMKHIDDIRLNWDMEICGIYQLPIPKIEMRYMTGKWGLCYPTEALIRISTRLIHYPIECLDYVLLHEYVHFLEPNHSKRFWNLVKKYMPNYKQAVKLLK